MPQRFWFNILLLLFPCSLLTHTVIEPEWLTIEDGLSQGFVSCIMQDSEGFLWMGTKNGLNRYDGEHFQIFTHDPDDPYSISDDFIQSIYEYGDFLLVGTENGGLNLYYKKTKRFYKIPLKGEKSTLQVPYSVYVIHEDIHGQFWVTTKSEDQFFRIRFPENFQIEFSQNERLLNNLDILEIPIPDVSFDILLQNHGEDVLAYDNESRTMYRIDPKTGRFELFDAQPPDIYYCNSLISMSNKRLWLNCDDRFLLYEGEKWKDFQIGFPVEGLVYLADQKQFVVQSGKNNLYFDQESFQKQPVSQKDISFIIPGMQAGSKGNIIHESGVSWVGSNGYGVMKINPRLFKIRTYFEGLSISYTPFLSSEKEIYVHDYMKRFLYAPGEKPRLDKSVFSNKLPSQVIEDDLGDFWVTGFKDYFFFTINKVLENGKVEEKKRVSHPIDPGWYAVFYSPEDRSILAACQNLMILYDIETDNIQTFNLQDLLTDYAIYSATKTKNGHCWIGTNRGLVHAIPDGQGFRFELISKGKEGKNGLRTNEVASLLVDPEDDNIIWIGTKGGGLHRLDIRDMSFTG